MEHLLNMFTPAQFGFLWNQIKIFQKEKNVDSINDGSILMKFCSAHSA